MQKFLRSVSFLSQIFPIYLFIFIKIFTVVLAYLTEHTAGISRSFYHIYCLLRGKLGDIMVINNTTVIRSF